MYVNEFKNRNRSQHYSYCSSNSIVCIRSNSSKPTSTSFRFCWLPSWLRLPPPLLLPPPILPPPLLLPPPILPPPLLLPPPILLPSPFLLGQLKIQN